MARQIKIKWCAFGDKPEIWRFSSAVEIEIDNDVAKFITDEQICEEIYKQTNTYAGSIWKVIEPKMSPTRTHTAISVGDEIEIDGKVYICSDFGFIPKENAEIRKIENTIYSVVEREEVGVRDVFQIDQDRMMTRMADAEMGDY